MIPQSLFGVTATGPAHATIQVRPLPGNLAFGEATVRTIRGAVLVEFNQTGGFDCNWPWSRAAGAVALHVLCCTPISWFIQ